MPASLFFSSSYAKDAIVCWICNATISYIFFMLLPISETNCLLFEDDRIMGYSGILRNSSLFSRLTSFTLPFISEMLISLSVLDRTELGLMSRKPRDSSSQAWSTSLLMSPLTAEKDTLLLSSWHSLDCGDLWIFLPLCTIFESELRDSYLPRSATAYFSPKSRINFLFFCWKIFLMFS